MRTNKTKISQIIGTWIDLGNDFGSNQMVDQFILLFIFDEVDTTIYFRDTV